jgi:hypothetical protein
MNFDKGNIGVKDGIAIHNQGLYKLSDIVEKKPLNLENESSPTFERSKFAISFLIIALLLDLVIFFLVL